jgi:hypothetical protein
MQFSVDSGTSNVTFFAFMAGQIPKRTLRNEVTWIKNGNYSSRIDRVGSEVLIAVIMMSYIVWDIMPCSLVTANRRFGGTSLPSSGSESKPKKKPTYS